jgi:hypothetical protein
VFSVSGSLIATVKLILMVSRIVSNYCGYFTLCCKAMSPILGERSLQSSR